MATLNSILNAIFDLILYPFRALPPIYGLIAVSLVTGLLMLIIFKRTSNQQVIKQVKDRLKAHLLELRLYKDDLGLSFAAMKGVLGTNMRYLQQAIKPMLVLMAPTILILIQLAIRYEYRPLQIGESAIVSVNFANASALDEVGLDLPEGVRAETPPLRIKQKHQVDWRIQAAAEGSWEVNFRIGDEVVTKELVVGEKLRPLSSRRVGGKLVDSFLNPVEAPLPSTSAIKDIRIQYPDRDLSLWGWETNWLVVFFGFSVVTGFALKGLMGIEI